MAEKEISHKGIVRGTDGNGRTLVEIVSSSACSSCHAAGLCSAAEAVKKQVEVVTGNDVFPEGAEVEVVLRKSMGMKAVLLAYVIPLFILLILVVSLSYTNVHELVCGAAGLAGVAVWYLVLMLFKDRLKGEYVFYIKGK